MVHVVPPIDPGTAACSGGPTIPAAVLVACASQPSPGIADLEQIAAEAAAILPDGTPAAPLPPPLPDHVSPVGVNTAPAFARPNVVWLAATAAAAICAAAIVWAAWTYFNHEPAQVAQQDPVAAEEPKQPEQPGHEQLDRVAPANDIIGDPSGGAAAPERAAPIDRSGAAPAADLRLEQNNHGASEKAEPEPRPEVKVEATVSPAADDASVAAAADPKDGSQDSASTDERTARKPSLRIQELDIEAAPAEPAPIESAGQIGADSKAADGGEEEARLDSMDPAPAVGVADEPPLRRIPPRQVDVRAQLATKVAVVDFETVPLHVVLRTLSDLANVPVAIDVDGLRAVGITVDRQMTVAATSSTIEELLEQTLSPLGLAARGAPGQLLVTAENTSAARKARYAVDDLVRPGDPSIGELAAMARAVVAGNPNGHSALVLDAAGDAIFLTGTETEHDRMIELCEKLRVARGRPLRTRYNLNKPDPRFDPRRFELATRRAKAESLLERSVTAGVGRPAPLRDVVDYLAQQTGAIILLDGPALAAAGLSVDTEARLRATDEPLRRALEKLLEPLALSYRVAGRGVLEITTPAAAAHRPCIEFYSMRGARFGLSPDESEIERVRKKLFQSAGVESSTAAAVFDAPSDCLIVSAPYADHVRLELALRVPESARRRTDMAQ